MADSINEINNRTDQTVRVFDQFYEFEANVPANEYDAVYSFFRSVYSSDQAAGTFTVALFRVAEQSRTPIMTLLSQLQGQDQVDLTVTLAYYLNGLRSNATLLGVGSPTLAYPFVARTVLI